MKKIKVKITFIEEVLGGTNADPEIYKRFIAAQQPPEKVTEELKALPEQEEMKLTVFPRMRNGRVACYDYQWKGFFKDACGMLRNVDKTECSKIKAYKKTIDGLIFVSPRMIPFEFDGEIGMCQRPLRAQTMQGERIALAASETVPEGTTLTFEITVLNDDLMKMVTECLDYGTLRGFSQWRNSGKGRFTWEIVQ